MRVEFLIGPAGAGKTFRCLEGARTALKESPEGLPLLFLAPKQATFQLERDLLSDPELHGYTRLQILSFDRLADYVIGAFFSSPPQLLSQEGRVMVLRAILARENSRLMIFKSAARTAGFARELSGMLEELQRHKVTPAQLRGEAVKQRARPQLSGKLSDFALLLESYTEWLNANQLEDPNRLLDIAAEAISGAGQRHNFQIEALWLDGFAEMTPQEIHLLASLLPFCQRATLAFCLEEAADAKLWTVPGRSCRRCLEAVRALPGSEVVTTPLARTPGRNRFSGNPFAAHLEKHWADAVAYNSTVASDILDLFAPKLADSIQWFTCANPEAEAVAAVHEILRFVRDRGGLYRETAVLVRRLQGYEQPLQRAFRRYGIPHFIDQRQPVAHHPLAELTRYALRTVAFDWRIEDWFGALKSGLVPADDSALDRLELEAIARGWQGDAWHHRFKIENDAAKAEAYERLRKLVMPPFTALRKALSGKHVNGPELCGAIRGFWETLNIERTLESWSRKGTSRDPQSQMHLTVWNEIDEWLDNLQIAFSHLELPLQEWLPILEAGLCNLTIGIVPPAIDQVLIGSVDRSRNPDLKLVLVLGMNEGVFPAVPSVNSLLTETDREHLQTAIPLGPDPGEQSAHERYLAYIACTRARERLVLTSCHFDSLGRAMNTSGLLAKFEALFPGFKTHDWQPETDWRKAQHASEVVRTLIQRRLNTSDDHLARVAALPAFQALRERLDHLPNFAPDECLSPAVAEKLYGRELRTAITRLEQFGQCQFRFFVTAGLRARERRTFELDPKKFGDFQHQVLRRFHEHLQKQNKRWRDLAPQEARELIGQIARQHAEGYHEGLFTTDEQDRFTARQLSLAMEEMMEVLVGWMRNYQFDPVAVELRFDDPGQIPAWRIPLQQGRLLALTGSIDRVDVLANGDAALCVVIDYKSSARKLERILLHHGIQMQLPAYLAVLRHLQDPQAVFGVRKLIPAGLFYVSLRRTATNAKNKREAIAGLSKARTEAYRHLGRFNQDFLPDFDCGHAELDEPAGQFNYRQNKDGTFDKRYPDPLPPDEFEKLLADTEAQLQEFGNSIFRGETRVNPYRHGFTTPCERCDYRSICRIDPWTHKFRALEAP